jgi:hypothetical protein
MSQFDLPKLKSDVVRYDADAKIKELIGRKNVAISLAEVLKLTRKAQDDKERQELDPIDRPKNFFAKELRAKQFRDIGKDGKRNVLFERLSYALKKKLDVGLFSKEIKNEQKNEERRRLGYTRIEYQAF